MDALLIDACGNYIIIIDMAKLNQNAESCFEIFKRNFSFWLAYINYDLLCILTYDGGVVADFWNKDGTREDVCYNALRSIPLVYRNCMINKIFEVKTRRGIFRVYSEGEYNELYIPYSFIDIVENSADGILIDVGTPHFVTYLSNHDDILKIKHTEISASLNVNFSFYSDQAGYLTARTFERGVGETNSCGSGAVSICIASELKFSNTFQYSFRRTVKYTSGETLIVSSSPQKNAIILQGRSRLLDLYKVSGNLKTDFGSSY